MEKMSGKKALLEMLKSEGVKHIFGNPGTSEGPIIDMLGDYPELKYFLTLQESVAIGMAESYARLTGKASFVSLHVDSGLANGIALMLDAYNYYLNNSDVKQKGSAIKPKMGKLCFTRAKLTVKFGLLFINSFVPSIGSISQKYLLFLKICFEL